MASIDVSSSGKPFHLLPLHFDETVQATCPHSQVIQVAAGHVAAELFSVVLLQLTFQESPRSVGHNNSKHLNTQAITLSSEMAWAAGKPFCQRQQPYWFLCYLHLRLPR